MFADVDNLSEYVGEIDDSLLDVERSLDVGVVSIPDDSEASSASQELSLPPHPCHHATARGSVIKGCSGDSGAISVGEEVDGIDSTASYLTSTHLAEIKDEFAIPARYSLSLPKGCHGNSVFEGNQVVVYEDSLCSGLYFPVDLFVAIFLRTYGVPVSQLTPNGWMILSSSIFVYGQLGLELDINVF